MYDNLVIVHVEIYRLIHAISQEMIVEILYKWRLTSEHIKKTWPDAPY